MNTIIVYKADPISEEETAAEIRITAAMPDFNAGETRTEAADRYMRDAELLDATLHASLPGGTYDRLLAVMLKRKASYLAVSYSGFV